MTRPQHILALVTSVAALTAFAPAASAASEDGRSRVASAKPAARTMVVAPARTSTAKFSAARTSAAKFSATRRQAMVNSAAARFRPMLPIAKVRPGVG